jgi:hypothetical protein
VAQFQIAHNVVLFSVTPEYSLEKKEICINSTEKLFFATNRISENLKCNDKKLDIYCMFQ